MRPRLGVSVGRELNKDWEGQATSVGSVWDDTPGTRLGWGPSQGGSVFPRGGAGVSGVTTRVSSLPGAHS